MGTKPTNKLVELGSIGRHILLKYLPPGDPSAVNERVNKAVLVGTSGLLLRTFALVRPALASPLSLLLLLLLLVPVTSLLLPRAFTRWRRSISSSLMECLCLSLRKVSSSWHVRARVRFVCVCVCAIGYYGCMLWASAAAEKIIIRMHGMRK